MADRDPIRTGDGSYTLIDRNLNEHYHSHFGAVTESEHIFIRAGLMEVAGLNSDIRVLEVGFGTGLNALLTLSYAASHGLTIYYAAIEPNPVDPALAISLEYPGIIGGKEASKAFAGMHHAAWGETLNLHGGFRFLKVKTRLQEFEWSADKFNLVYFDAFSPEVQPEMWSLEMFHKVAEMMHYGGVLVTYSCKGSVRSALKAAGFRTEKLPGPPGKREILRAVLTRSPDVKSP